MNHNLLQHFPEGKTPRPNQLKLLNQIENSLKTDKKFIVINAPTGLGKCWRKGTPMMLADGEILPVEDLKIGQEVLGSDSIPKKITSTNSGYGELYEIRPKRHAESMYVNAEHILVLKCTNMQGNRKHKNRLILPNGEKVSSGETVHITVKEYFNLTKTAKHCLKWVQIPFDLKKPDTNDLPISPWLLGFWLADGSSNCSIITKPNAVEMCLPDVESMGWEVNKAFSSCGCEIARIRGGMAAVLKKNNLYKNKHIPINYIRSGVEIRKQLLAGLLDGDGYYSNKCFEIVQKNKALAKDIMLLARSLGFSVTNKVKIVDGEEYQRMILSGDVELPTRGHIYLERKQIKNPLLTGFDIIPIGEGEYFGITIEGDTRELLMPDGTISHNSFISATIANASAEPDDSFRNFVNSYRIWNPMSSDEAYNFPHAGAAILTVTKNLQDQYQKDFTDLNLLKGKSNYICEYDNTFEVDNAPCIGDKGLKKSCFDCDRCLYYNARNESIANKIGLFNYSVWLSMIPEARRKEVLICDEASELENIIIDHFTFSVDYETLEKLLDVKKYERVPSEVPNEAYKWLLKLNETLKEAIEEIKNSGKNKDKFRLRGLTNLQESITRVSENWGRNGENSNSVEYIVEKVVADKFNPNIKEGVIFVPFKANKLAYRLFETVERVILLSATFIDHRKEMADLGIGKDDYEYIEAPSVFDPEKSPIRTVGKYPLTYNQLENNLPKVIDEILLKILDKHKNEKGLIHTVSFKITKAIQDRVFNKRLLFREGGTTNEVLMKEHAENSEPTVMVSPSMSHGVDLMGDLGRFQVIMKVPYLPLSSKRIKRLSKEDYQWYVNRTISTIVQMSGRCTRNDEDEAVTYILDGSVVTLLKRNWNKLPKFFRDRIK